MSVLIKGMEMPKSCAECRFKGHGGYDEFIEWCDLTNKKLGYWGNTKAKWYHERKPFCPLVEVDETAILDGWEKVYPDGEEVRDKSECVVGCDGYCEECPIAENYNLEDDDSPCLNCGVEE